MNKLELSTLTHPVAITYALRKANATTRNLFDKVFNDNETSAEFERVVSMRLETLFIEHIENTRWINMTLFMTTTLYSWPLVIEILLAPQIQRITLSNLIHTLWLAMEKNQSLVVITMIISHRHRLRDTDLAAATHYLEKQNTCPIPSSQPLFIKTPPITDE